MLLNLLHAENKHILATVHLMLRYCFTSSRCIRTAFQTYASDLFHHSLGTKQEMSVRGLTARQVNMGHNPAEDTFLFIRSGGRCEVSRPYETFIHSPTDLVVSCRKNNIKIYIKTSPTCFGVTVTPSSGSVLICAY